MKKYILLPMLTCLFAIVAFTYQSQIRVSGTVTDEAGNPLGGVTIGVKSTNVGTITNSSGYFTIQVPDENVTLTIVMIGFEVQEIKVGKKRTFKVQLVASSNDLSEIVVTAMSTRPARSKIGRQLYASPSIHATSPLVNGYEEVFGYGVNGRLEQKQTDNNIRDREGYDYIKENEFLKTGDNPLSTFSIDVDGAAYSNIRRMLQSGQLPPAGAVRIEEMINYFTYKYPQPKGEVPFSVNTEIAACPWNKAHHIVSIGLQGKKIVAEQLPASNLVFLIDVSGSMESEDKLPLVKSSLKLLVDQLRQQDKVAIVVYAGNAGLVLPVTSGNNKQQIKDAINNLEAGGSTAGGEGIELAYRTAATAFVKEGNNRVILCTDGDFNVGMSSDDELERLIENKRKTGIYLTVLGYGTGNYQDAKMQKLANKGNGNHAYIDNSTEAKKVLVNEFGGTLFTIAKDVKLQVEFNPAKVQGYRLIGYENRMLAKEDFNNDKKDAGEMGSGHTVTALYEIIPVGVPAKELQTVDELRYSKPKPIAANGKFDGELLNIKLRYKLPTEETSNLITHAVQDNVMAIDQASENLQLAAAVAQFGMVLRNSTFKGNSTFAMVSALAQNTLGDDAEGYRSEFIKLVKAAEKLNGKVAVAER